MRRKLKRVGAGNATVFRFKTMAEMKHWQSCDGCGKRFSQQDMVWIDAQGWLWIRCQKRFS